jgi:hypothetical protein
MSLLESVFRRIIIRNADKAITGTAKAIINSAGTQTYTEKAKLPTIGSLIWNVISFTLWLVILSSILLAIGTKLAYAIPFLFIWRVIRPLAYNYTYDYKPVAITKTDRRFRTGSKTIGYRYVKDKEAKINYTDSQILISKIEGVIKLALFLACLLFIYRSTTKIKFELENMSYADKVKVLVPGDTLYNNSIKIDYFGKYKDEYSKGIRITHSGNDSVRVAGIFIKVDSATDKYGNKYEKYFEVKPLREPQYYDPILFDEKDRLSKSWFVAPSDVNIGERKLKKDGRQ